MTSPLGKGDVGKDLYIQDLVLIKSIVPVCQEIDFDNNLGTLTITEYDEPIGKCLEWRQFDLTVETEDTEDWAVVSGKTRRSRTRSESSGGSRRPALQKKISNLKSFKTSKNNSKITLFFHDGTIASFIFQRGSPALFVNYLKSILTVKQSNRDQSHWKVISTTFGDSDVEKSFAELDLDSDTKSRPSQFWKIVENFQNRPYETTIVAFAKVAETLLYNSIDEKPEIAQELYDSLKVEESSPPLPEYEVVELPDRCLPKRSAPISVREWPTFFKYDGSIVARDVVNKFVFQGGVDPKIRKEVWGFLLELYPYESTFTDRERIKEEKKKEYYRMKAQWSTISNDQIERFSAYKERKHLIEKDVMRTDRHLEFFADDDSPHLKQLEDILMTYVMYNFDLGYVQGMSDLLAPLLYLFQDEIDAFWCFTTVIRRLLRNFDIDQAGMKEQLKQVHQILAVIDPELAKYLVKQDSGNMFFCFRWLLVWFKREFSYDDIFILWDVLWSEPPCKNYHLLICVAILNNERDSLMTKEFGFTEILKHINELANKIHVNFIIELTSAIYMQLRGAHDLPNSVREILGFPLLEAPTVNTHSAENFRKSNSDAEEEAYERSINMHLL